MNARIARIPLTALVAIVACLGLSKSADAELLKAAEFDVDPTTELGGGWILQGNTYGLGGGIGSYDTTSSGVVARLTTGTEGGMLPGTQSVVSRMRVADDGGSDSYVGTSISLILGDRWFLFGVVDATGGENSPKLVVDLLSNGTAEYSLDTSLFHTYGLSITDVANGVFDIYVDDVKVLSDLVTPSITDLECCDGRLEFGDTGSAGEANSEWDFVRVYGTAIPEPTTVGLMALGSLCLLCRRAAQGLRDHSLN